MLDATVAIARSVTFVRLRVDHALQNG